MALSAHASRWLIAAVAAPLLLAVIFLAPPLFFFLVVAVFGALAWWEFHDICLGESGPWLRAAGLAGWLLTAAGAHFFGPAGQQAGLVLAVAGGGLYFIFRYPQIENVMDQAGRFALGHAYISLFFSFLLLLFALDRGPRWILFTLLVTFLGDACAFYVGRTLGRRPLYPAVSPKKTWEGLAGGVAGSGLTAAALGLVLAPAAWWETGLLGLFLGGWAAAGDLFESMLKRAAGVKDSGHILLGHGGVWDRVDALLFNVPAVYFFALFRGGLG
ncbi:MAG: phosphatidate cytidylyltransferase [Thermodesulfobacteriota bacterium]